VAGTSQIRAPQGRIRRLPAWILAQGAVRRELVVVAGTGADGAGRRKCGQARRPERWAAVKVCDHGAGVTPALLKLPSSGLLRREARLDACCVAAGMEFKLH
jgi:hypothetical protein